MGSVVSRGERGEQWRAEGFGLGKEGLIRGGKASFVVRDELGAGEERAMESREGH